MLADLGVLLQLLHVGADGARGLLGGAADLALFGKAQLAGDPQQYQAARLLAGARFTVRY